MNSLQKCAKMLWLEEKKIDNWQWQHLHSLPLAKELIGNISQRHSLKKNPSNFDPNLSIDGEIDGARFLFWHPHTFCLLNVSILGYQQRSYHFGFHWYSNIKSTSNLWLQVRIVTIGGAQSHGTAHSRQLPIRISCWCMQLVFDPVLIVPEYGDSSAQPPQCRRGTPWT